ncbi:hypothetical protein PIIN_02048 [Serendipita indica DSM 11827]|uniref:Uncharacterized protein n=1 Tax=Serendipita indica (strain DSM 11827) TaxID=1109443 RepID=G4TA27_SERID|nr:hypothetical protein PIIN_02048 [Serendipita indica DSM 11827]
MNFRRQIVGLSSSTLCFRRYFTHNSEIFKRFGHLRRVAVPKQSEKIQHGKVGVQHPTGPIVSRTRGEEHIYQKDLNYTLVTSEDEAVGLVLRNLHPLTKMRHVSRYCRAITNLRHCWIYSEGVMCLRFEDEASKRRFIEHFRSLKEYPFTTYDKQRRNWTALAPADTPVPEILPLTTEYNAKTREPGKVLVMRTPLGLPQATVGLFRAYTTPGASIQTSWTRFLAHDIWVYEYYIKFPTEALAQKALEENSGKRVTIPHRYLLPADKVRYPYGKKVHLWLGHTGLTDLPHYGTHDTMLKKFLDE